MTKEITDESMKKLCEALEDVITNVDEDCPSEYRTRHLKDAMESGTDLLKSLGYYNYDEFLEDSSDDHPKYDEGIK